MNELNRLFFKCCFWAFGWKVVGRLPELKKYMITVAPHTSNWDFIVGLAAKYIIRLKAQFLGKDSLFKIPFLVHYLSQFMTLLPGDVISTGTPPGVGLGFKPEPIYVKPGDVIELGIEGLGTSKQTAVAYTKK